MRVVPVMDLLGGQAVHAIKGEREQYRPVKSVLCGTSDPLDLARAFRDTLGLDEVYVADLDAIRGHGETCHRELITSLSRREKMKVILDAGVSDAGAAQAWLELGVRRIVIGSETLREWNTLPPPPGPFRAARLRVPLRRAACSRLHP